LHVKLSKEHLLIACHLLLCKNILPEMKTAEEVLKAMQKASSSKTIASQKRFAIGSVNNIGLTVPQMRMIAKQAGKNHSLALELWKTKIHEARHIAAMIADPKQVTEKLMEQWLRDFNSWDIVDGCCSGLFDKTPMAYEKAMEWSKRKKEFEKRAGFTMMATLVVHDKKGEDKKFEEFFPFILNESGDERNFVKKAVNWALRQIGKRNARLCKKAIQVAKKIYEKGDSSSRWIASDALRELEKYQKEGKIKNTGTK
jgi:3-methyladenine DNA glycosylase AlkD